MRKAAIFLPVFFYFTGFIRAQTAGTDTTVKSETINYGRQKDVVDIIYAILKKDASKRVSDTVHPKPGRVYFSGAPAIAYSLQTGAAALVNGNFAFYLGPDTTTKISSVLAEVQYTQYHQLLMPFRINTWSRNNQYNFIGDWRFLKYPQDTYGIGSQTSLSNGYTVDYNYVRIYQFVLKKIVNELYGGFGVQYDNHWHIKEITPPPGGTDFEKYGFSTSSVSSGIAANVLYNTVKNMLNPAGGSIYANVIVRQG